MRAYVKGVHLNKCFVFSEIILIFLKMASAQVLVEGSAGLRNEISAGWQPSRIFTPAVVQILYDTPTN